LESITGAAGLLCDTACAGLIGFEDDFARLSQTRFRLSPQVNGHLAPATSILPDEEILIRHGLSSGGAETPAKQPENDFPEP